MRDVVRELIDAVAGLRGISGNRQAELHAQLDEQTAAPEALRPPSRPSLMSLLELDRAEWLDSYFHYNSGEHVVIVEPTGGGKTFLAYQMLGEVMRRYPDLS